MATRKHKEPRSIPGDGGTAAAPARRRSTPRRQPLTEVSEFQAASAGTATAAVSEVEVEFPTESERREIELLAYLYWESRGGQGGSAEEDWLRAEQVVRARRAIA